MLTKDQQEAFNSIFQFIADTNEHVFVLEGYAGTGKEQPISVTVQTPLGPKNFGNLQVGDFIFGKDGNPTKVLKIYPQGQKEVYRICFRDGTSTRCGANHLWSVHTKKNKTKFKTYTTEQLIEAGLENTAGPKFGVPLCAPVNYPSKDFPFDPYLIGAVIGDGYLGGVGTPAISCSNQDIDIVQRIRASLPADFSLNFRSTVSCPQYNIVDNGILRRNRFKEYIKEIGLNVGSHQKHIPSIFLLSSIEQRKALLNGLMDTDGCSHKNRISYSTMSLQLAKDVQTLVQSLGGTAIIRSSDRTKDNKGIEYSVNVKTFFNPFSCSRKAKEWKYSSKNPPSRYITEITKEGFEEQMCITVSAKDSLYLTDHFIVTHNTHLVSKLLENIPKYFATQKLINPEYEEMFVELTATTNKAAEALQEQVHQPVKTIFNLLGLVVRTDYETNSKSLGVKRGTSKVYNSIIFIDEASYADGQLISYIFSQTENCKIIFIGDPAQLSMSYGTAPVFTQGWPTARLTNVVRQAEDSPITQLTTSFRNTVNTGVWESFVPDGTSVIKLDKSQVNWELEKEFTRPDWHFKDSKVLAWTNKRVISYNLLIREMVKSTPELCVGDYATINSFINAPNGNSYKTDETVLITGIIPNTVEHGVKGNSYYLNSSPNSVFMPHSIADKKRRIAEAIRLNNFYVLESIDKNWVDLRATYASTVNKAQGSTYDKVFVDLNDISKCNSGNTIARMLYVACSRPKSKLYLIGDLV
jgi:hypothetical protein